MKPKNWKKKKDKVLLGCIKTSEIRYATDKALFEINQWESVFKKLDKIQVPMNPSDNNKKIWVISM